MNKIKYFLLIFILIPFNILAANKIDNIDMNIHVNKDGSADITEVWKVKGQDGTEWYKAINGYYEDDITNFEVTMDDAKLQYKKWDIDESLNQKKGYYGINTTSNGIELCWGKYDLGKNHTFTIKYTLNNIVENVSDAQIIYFNFIGELSNVDFERFSLVLDSYYEFSDTLDVWGYGYKGYAYVQNGKIYMSTEENSDMDNSYVVLLAKFDKGIFESDKMYQYADDFAGVLSLAEEGTFDFDYSPKKSIIDKIFPVLRVIFYIIFVAGIIKFSGSLKKYGYINNKVIPKDKELNYFHEIPCNKDINYGNTLLYLNNRDYKDSNIFGAIILKFIKNNVIEMNPSNKEEIILKGGSNFDTTLENEIYDVLVSVSENNIVTTKKLKKWCQKNYNKFFKLFTDNMQDNVANLTTKGQIRKRSSKDECKQKQVLSDDIYNESIKLYGLKMFLKDMSDMKNKELIDVKLWDQYLMFAFLFGIADKVSKTLKDIYPTEMQATDFDYDTVVFVQHISNTATVSASSARSAAESYSGGGGGFSSGGGGGFSSGGGGGGSR